MSAVDELTARLAELQGERRTIEGTMTREDLVANVDRWLETARAHAAGSSRLVLGGQATGEHLASVLFEDRLDDEGLSGRTVARLEAQGFGGLTDRVRKQRLGKVDQQIEQATGELREARRAAALAEVEAEFAA